MHKLVIKITIIHPGKENLEMAKQFFNEARDAFPKSAPKGSSWTNEILEEE